ncbi:MAG: DUF4105 domain-containing protein [Gemmatimonadales bacterium]|nr:MAG: DUF4105 domain-containing protein [Gemmatimonadales bacterium]
MDRSWAQDMSVLATAEITGEGAIQLSDIRDWRYLPGTVASQEYRDASFDPDDIVDLWMYEQEFGEKGLIAHTFVVFEFDESYGPVRYLGLSMEARREADEDYSILRGMLRGFEAAHVWATEEDLVTRRVTYQGNPVRRYRLEIPAESRARIFAKMVEETRALATKPRWYNTVLYNCTSSLIRYANESEPGSIPLHYSYVLTGKIDEYLERLGYLDPRGTRVIDGPGLAEEGLRPGVGA